MIKTFLKIVSGVIVLAGLSAAFVYGDFWGTRTAFAVGDLMIDWGVPAGNPIFTVANFAPGATESRVVQVTNGATAARPLGVRGVKTAGNGLSDALQITISNGPTTLYGPKTVTQFFADSSDPDGIPLLTIPAGAVRNITFAVTFAPSAGNILQGDSVTLDITLGLSIDTPAACDGITFSGPPIFGTQRGDSLRGTPGNDLIFGMEGGDSIRGGGGNDCLIGGGGGDSILGEAGDDVLFGEAGGDSLLGGDGNDQINGGDGGDGMQGGNGSDTLRGGAGSDSANGGAGTDTCEAEGKAGCEL